MSFWRKSLVYSLLMIGQAASLRACGLVANGLLARMLTPLDWGSLQAITAVAGSLSQSLKLSIDGALQVRLAETGEVRAGEFSRDDVLGAGVALVALVAVVALVVGFGVSGPAAKLFGDSSLAPWMGFAGMFAASQLAIQLCAVLVSLGAFRAYAAINVYAALANLAVLATFYAIGARGFDIALEISLATQLGTALATVGFSIRTWRAHGLRLRFGHVVGAAWQLIRLGLPLHLSTAMPTLVWLFLNAQLARKTGVESLAGLRVVALVNQLVGFAPGAVAQTFISQFAAARGDAKHVPARDFLRYLRVIVASTLLTALAVASFAPPLIRVAFGQQYLWTTSLVQLGLMSITILTVKQALLVGLISERRTEFALLEALVTSVVCASLAQVLLPRLQTAGFLLSELAAHATSLLLLAAATGWRMRGEAVGRGMFAAFGALSLGVLALAVAYLARDLQQAWLLPPLAFLCCAGLLPFGLFDREERAGALREWARLRQRFAARS